MPAENATLNDSASSLAAARRRQFSLRSLFFFSLHVSPLFLALLFLREGLSFQTPSTVMMFFNVMACAAIYGGIFASRAEIRRLRSSEKPPGRSVLPVTRKGALYGAFFLSLAFGPAILAQLLRSSAVSEQLAWLQKFWSPANLFELFRRLGGCLLELAPVLAFLAFMGFFLGAAGGFVAGAILEFRKQNRRVCTDALPMGHGANKQQHNFPH